MHPPRTYNSGACRLALAPLAAWILISLLLSPWLLTSTFFFCNEIQTGHATSFTPISLNDQCDLAVQTASGTYTVTQPCSTIADCKELQHCHKLQLAINHYQPKRCSYIVSGPDGDSSTQLPQAMSWYVVNAWMNLGLAAFLWMLLVMAASWVAAAASAMVQAAPPHCKWPWTTDTELTRSDKERPAISEAASTARGTDLERGQRQGSMAGAAPRPPNPESWFQAAEWCWSVAIFAGILLLCWVFASLALSPELFSATFRCNEVLHGRATSVQRSDVEPFNLQGALCDVGLQLEDSWTHTISVPCSKVAPCEGNVSACANLQVAANHMSRSLCLRIMFDKKPYEYVAWLPLSFVMLWDLLGLVLLLVLLASLVLGSSLEAGTAIARFVVVELPALVPFLFPPIAPPPRGPPRGRAPAGRGPAQASSYDSSLNIV